MKATTLRLKPHGTAPGEHVVDIFHRGVLVGSIFAEDGCGVRIFTKHGVTTTAHIEPTPDPDRPRLARIHVLIDPATSA